MECEVGTCVAGLVEILLNHWRHFDRASGGLSAGLLNIRLWNVGVIERYEFHFWPSFAFYENSFEGIRLVRTENTLIYGLLDFLRAIRQYEIRKPAVDEKRGGLSMRYRRYIWLVGLTDSLED